MEAFGRAEGKREAFGAQRWPKGLSLCPPCSVDWCVCVCVMPRLRERAREGLDQSRLNQGGKRDSVHPWGSFSSCCPAWGACMGQGAAVGGPQIPPVLYILLGGLWVAGLPPPPTDYLLGSL